MILSNLVKPESMNISQTVTIMPRLEYIVNLLNEITQILQDERGRIQKINRFLVDCETNDEDTFKKLDFERRILFSLEILSEIKQTINSISGIISIPKNLPYTISLTRTISADLFNLSPTCSQKLSELSVHLGSIILDSGILSEARFDFGQTNIESSMMLKEVKLTVDSKLNKQYPNVDFFKSFNT